MNTEELAADFNQYQDVMHEWNCKSQEIEIFLRLLDMLNDIDEVNIPTVFSGIPSEVKSDIEYASSQNGRGIIIVSADNFPAGFDKLMEEPKPSLEKLLIEDNKRSLIKIEQSIVDDSCNYLGQSSRSSNRQKKRDNQNRQRHYGR